MQTSMFLGACDFVYLLKEDSAEGRGEKVKAEAEREKHSVWSIASLWSDIITCSLPGRSSPACPCLGNGKGHQHYKVSHLAQKKRWIRSKCTVPLGLRSLKAKAQYSLSQSIGVQTVHSKRKTVRRSHAALVGGTPHSLDTPDGKKAFNRIEIKPN